MKKILFFCILIFISASFLQAQTVNGDTLTVSGKKILKVWGTHYERGFATGYLMGENIMNLAQEYFLGSVFGNSAPLYEYAKNIYLSASSIEDKYHDEADGLINGMIDAGVDIYDDTLQRELDKDDILLVNAIVDLAGLTDLPGELDLGCSSMSAWGNNTIDDPELNGDLVLTRQMDWTPHPALNDNHILVVHFPAENDEVNWMSFTFPGLFGALSAINEEGLCAFMNVGNNHDSDNPANLHPVLLSIRNGIESYDYNGDYVTNALDVTDAVSDKIHLSGAIIHTSNQDFGLIAETNNERGTEVRDDSENTMVPQECLVATNHFRKLYNPTYCYRYNNISDSLNANSNITIARSWQVLQGASGIPNNMHMIEYAPSQNLVKWSTSLTGQPAYTIEPSVFELSELFTMPVSIDNDYIEVISVVNTFPNPFVETASLSFSLSQNTAVELSIYNIRGQKIKSLISDSRGRGTYTTFWNGKDESEEPVPSGIYFYRFETSYMNETGRLILVK
ncbi:MAG: T9SS type A sorting domain-containing protein [Candidatus Cloacimonetes bacterium]|nr:T9SS type A sorting domain-containing protein [Candidatus Cloacimonadota bacterium]MCF7814221.1 T9SS type A sorting domain-containing protein [Candidatus Cloacimonadota bacterium]MCF7868120.1 T9SS type A sorting domain-containing protein [Candidatus Cloacimonadota bacterium]MCF7883586.1 T9SS type A sorting domain-containing protein [Candidatus Cloacimonadota bacterium]